MMQNVCVEGNLDGRSFSDSRVALKWSHVDRSGSGYVPLTTVALLVRKA